MYLKPSSRFPYLTNILQNSKSLSWKKVTISLLQDTKLIYSDNVLLRWSIWWALSTCGYMLVVNYVQNLWETIYSSSANQSRVYNGAVEALATVLGAVDYSKTFKNLFKLLVYAYLRSKANIICKKHGNRK